MAGPRPGRACAAGCAGDDRGAGLAGAGGFGEVEDVPGHVGAGDGLHGEPGAGLNVPGERAIGQLDRAQRVPVEIGGGELVLHSLQIAADAAQVGGHDGAEEAEQQTRPGAHGGVAGAHAPGADRDQAGWGRGSFIGAVGGGPSRWCRSGGEIIVVLGWWRLAKSGPRAVTTTSAPRMAWAAKPGSKTSGLTRTSAWPAGGICGAAR